MTRFLRLLVASMALLGACGAAAEAPSSGPVVMYATDWCGYCARARAYFARKGIQYVEHNVEKSAAAHAEFKRLGGKGVPLIVHNGQTLRGFSEPAFEALMARSTR
jgi:glutaredoxin